MWLRGTPPMVPNPPPTTIFPSGCTTVATTVAVALGLALKSPSKVPSARSRTIELRNTPFTYLKVSPMITFPSGCPEML